VKNHQLLWVLPLQSLEFVIFDLQQVAPFKYEYTDLHPWHGCHDMEAMTAFPSMLIPKEIKKIIHNSTSALTKCKALIFWFSSFGQTWVSVLPYKSASYAFPRSLFPSPREQNPPPFIPNSKEQPGILSSNFCSLQTTLRKAIINYQLMMMKAAQARTIWLCWRQDGPSAHSQHGNCNIRCHPAVMGVTDNVVCNIYIKLQPMCYRD